MVIVVGLNRVEGVGALFHAPVSICGLSVLILKHLSPTVNLLLFSFLHLWPGPGASQHSLFMMRASLVYCAAPSLLDGERSSSLKQR